MFDNMMLRFKFRYHVLMRGLDHILIHKPTHKKIKFGEFDSYLKKYGYRITKMSPTYDYKDEVTFLKVYINTVV